MQRSFTSCKLIWKNYKQNLQNKSHSLNKELIQEKSQVPVIDTAAKVQFVKKRKKGSQLGEMMVIWLEVVLEKLQTGVEAVEEALEEGVVVVEVRMDKMLLKIGDRVQLKQAKVQIHIEIKIFLLMMNLRLFMI